MAEDVNVQDVNLDESDPVMRADDYIANINKLKANTVPRDQYEELLKEKQVLANAVLEGDTIANDKVPELTIKEKETKRQTIINRLFDTMNDRSNIDIAKDMLDLRDLTIDLDGPDKDPFLPHGTMITATQNDYITAKKVADGLKHCIDEADNDSEFFTNELQRITKDAMPMYRNKNRR